MFKELEWSTVVAVVVAASAIPIAVFLSPLVGITIALGAVTMAVLSLRA